MTTAASPTDHTVHTVHTDPVTEIDAITEIVSRLGCWLDGHGGDPARIYDRAVVVHSPRGETRGIDEVVARVGPSVDHDERSQHFHTDALVDLDGDHAVVRANQLVLSYRPQQPPHRTAGLRVEYRFGRRPEGWRIVAAEITLEWIVGELPT